MTEDVRSHALKVLGDLKRHVQSRPGFLKDAELKALYVVVSTAEGAVAFDDIEELARLCATFAGKKAQEMDEEDGGPPPFSVVS